MDEKQTVMMMEPRHLDQLLHPQFEDEAAYQAHVIGTGLPASPGAAVGQAVFDAQTAEEQHKAGYKVPGGRGLRMGFIGRCCVVVYSVVPRWCTGQGKRAVCWWPPSVSMSC